MLTVPTSYTCAFHSLFWSVMQPAADPSEEQQHIPVPRVETEPVAAPAAPSEQKVQKLSEREVEILAFEGRWWKHAGSKEQAVRDTFGLSSTRYYQLLNGLLDNPAALEHDPVLVGRLRRLRSTRARTRRR
jgi:Protein of unknown function (DUF3263)